MCGKAYAYKEGLPLHIRAIHEKAFQCQKCQKILSSKVALETHMNFHEKTKPFTCSSCGHCYRSRLCLARHPCPNEEPRFNCDQCDKVCTTQDGLKQHRLSHGLSPKFSCVCGNVFKHRQTKGTSSLFYISRNKIVDFVVHFQDILSQFMGTSVAKTVHTSLIWMSFVQILSKINQLWVEK